MLRWLTAGESHGPALTAVIEGIPADVQVTVPMLQEALARRRLGYGRGARISFEKDQVTLTGGIRHGLSMGSPIAITIANTEWHKWETVMSPAPVATEDLEQFLLFIGGYASRAWFARDFGCEPARRIE